MTVESRYWNQLRPIAKIVLVLMLAGAIPLIYAAVEDFFGTDWDRTPMLDVLATGFVLAAIPVATEVTDWIARRNLLRLHLSTAFILMLLASGCIWLNLLPATLQKSASGGWDVNGRGWPFGSVLVGCREFEDAQKNSIALNAELPYGSWIANGIICLGILFVIAFIIEWQISKTQGATPLAEHAASGNHRHV